ncbi:hypothetical protein ScPMuIL_018584 [Solemya velum]
METLVQAVAHECKSITLLLVLSQMAVFILADPVNVALRKHIQAEITCGVYGREVFHSMAELNTNTFDRTAYYCDNQTHHPPSFMVDGDDQTWWQSTSRPNIYTSKTFTEKSLEAIITIDLEQEFIIESLSIQFDDAKRPGYIAIEKSVDNINYKPWVYRVKSPSDCENIFGVNEEFEPASIVGTICDTYTLATASFSDELIEFDFSGLKPLHYQHYSVSELVVMAECTCSGQQLGCDLNNVTGKYQCVCGGNAEGEFCQKCKPFFNQQPFLYSTPCEACNCFNHSVECYYDSNIAAQNKSMNSTGQYAGGGVCLRCQDNTAGVNCESCAVLSYRPQGNGKNDPCLPCNCSQAGIQLNPVTKLMGDCFLGDEAEPSNLTAGMQAGDCYCKQNVQGAKCDQCKPGFYNIRPNNILGCQDCMCDTAGSTSSECTPDAGGQCPCKPNVQNRDCNDCKEGYYGLSVNNTNGCNPCDCNKGGAVITTCDKGTGICICRMNVEGRQCDRPRDGFFYPDLHFLNGQFEKLRVNHETEIAGFKGTGYSVLHKNETSSATVILPATLPMSEKYYLIVRYRGDNQATGVVQVPQFGETQPDTITFKPCPDNWCYARVSNDKNFTLYAGPQAVRVQLVEDTTIFVDEVVAIPVEFINNPVVNDTTFYTDCDVISNAMQLGTDNEDKCKMGVFTLTTFTLKGVQPCSCHVFGSLNSTCELYGGQCPCQPGVTGRRCDTCITGNYGLTIGGCRPCNCSGVDQTCDGITGQCVCPNNTIGRVCDMCNLYHWGWDRETGCKPCDCNSTGAVVLQCNDTSGECLCKTGVAGDNCDTCQPGYKDFSISGCMPCNCNVDGSVDALCNNASSQCTCKNNTEGAFCDSCRAGSFFLSGANEKGCLDCICMGVTNSCISSNYKYTQTAMMLVKEQNGTRVSKLILHDLTSEFDTNITVIEQPGRISLSADVQPGNPLYWDSPDFSGNQLVLYGSSVTAVVSANLTDPTKASPEVNPKAVLIGQAGNITLEHVLSPWSNISQAFTLMFDSTQWTENGANVSRGRFILALSNIQHLFLPASLYSAQQTVSVESVEYTLASSQVLFGLQAEAVEMCDCGIEYGGLSCELISMKTYTEV